jgi:hypothetical protein
MPRFDGRSLLRSPAQIPISLLYPPHSQTVAEQGTCNIFMDARLPGRDRAATVRVSTFGKPC